MSRPKLEDYMKGICETARDFDFVELEEWEKAAQADGVSIYTDFLRVEEREDGFHWIYKCSTCDAEHDSHIGYAGDYVYIGSSPADDDRYSNYVSAVTCNALIIQLRNTFGKEPEGARLYAKTEMGGGGYKEVVCAWDPKFPKSYAYAMMLEGNLPGKWSQSALDWLAEYTGKKL